MVLGEPRLVVVVGLLFRCCVSFVLVCFRYVHLRSLEV